MVLLYAIADILSITTDLSRYFQDRELAYPDVHAQLNVKLDELKTHWTQHVSPTDATRTLRPTFSHEVKQLQEELRQGQGLWKGHHITLIMPGQQEEVDFDAVKNLLLRQEGMLSKVACGLHDHVRSCFDPSQVALAACFNVLSPDVLARLDERAAADTGHAELKRLGRKFGEARAGLAPLLDGRLLVPQRVAWRLAQDAKRMVLEAAAAPNKAEEEERTLQKEACRRYGLPPGSVTFRPSPALLAARAVGKVVSRRTFYNGHKDMLDMERCPNLATLVRIMLVIQPHTADVERGFAEVRAVKDPQRAGMGVELLEALMRIRLVGPPIKLESRQLDIYPFKEFDTTILPLAVEF